VSLAATVRSKAVPAITMAGAVKLKATAAPGLTVRLLVVVTPPSAPITVCAPATVAVQVAPVHEPSGLIVKVVELVTSPRLLPYASEPVAV
jgi:hypothetical protein